MMMISTPIMCMCSPRIIPQPGTCPMKSHLVSLSSSRSPGGLKWSSPGFHQKGGGCCRTLAIKQGLPFFWNSETDASDGVEVPAKNTRVHNFTGIKTMELQDPISPTKLVDDQLPSLLSMIIDGFPPLRISKYVDEAENRLHQYIERYQNAAFLKSYYRAGLSGAAYGHPEVINLDRLVAISINYGTLFLVDDLFFDTPNEYFQSQYGISRDVCRSPQDIQEYLDHLDAVFSQQVQPRNPAPLIETIMWEVGQYTLEMTNPEWFNHYVTCIVEHHHACVASLAYIVQGHNLYFKDVKSYAVMRTGNVGGKFIQMMIELADGSYIPDILRTNPYLENVTMATSIYIGFVNDVFSYHKESSLEQNPHNLITVLLECEEKPFVQTVHTTIDLVNAYARAVMDLEAKAWCPTLRNHVQNIIEFMAGNVYFSYMDSRYRHVDSIFPELRDKASSWKILPHAKGPGL